MTVQNDGNGTASASPTSAAAGTKITLTAAPKDGYHFREWQVIPSSVTISGNSFTMPDSNVTVKAIFEQNSTPPQLTYTVIVNGSYATVSGAGSYEAGTAVSIHAGNRSNYRFSGWTSPDGITFANAGSADTTFTMPDKNVTVTANWTYIGGNSDNGGGWYNPPTTYSVTIPTTAHGKVTVSPASASRGTTVTITAVPEDGYRLDILNVTSSGKAVPLAEKGNDKYTFTMPAGTVKVEATFILAETPGIPWTNPFADVTEGDWYYDAVQFVQERGLMNGYSDGRFGPNDTLTRAQLAQILFNKEGGPVVNYLMQYSDVSGEAWYTEAVRWATSQGIGSGYGSGMFGPNDPITREQLAVMLWRYSKSPAATNKELHFADADEISGFALDAMRWAVENGILNGYGDGRLGPQGQATRAQVAQMLKNFLKNE